MATNVSAAKRTDPWIPVGHPQFIWRSGADVQATWMRHTKWTPPSAGRTPFAEPKPEEFQATPRMRRVR